MSHINLSAAYPELGLPTLDERRKATLLTKELWKTFGEVWKESKFGIGSTHHEGKIHVTIVVPCKFVKKCQAVVDKAYPNPSIPILVTPQLVNVKSQVEDITPRSWIWPF